MAPPTGPVPDYYAILEIHHTATADVIKKAYHRIALREHPDKNGGTKHATEKFKLVRHMPNS
jgi:molecular chaperone DnaJ